MKSKIAPGIVCGQLYDIFNKEVKACALSPNLRLIFRTDYVDGIARRTNSGEERIYLPGWTIAHPCFAIPLHYLLHELCHHIVGLHHNHDDIFKAKEEEIHFRYGIKLGPYFHRDCYGVLAYSGHLHYHDVRWEIEPCGGS